MYVAKLMIIWQTMKSDIVLHKGEHVLIIDTKYYGNAMQYNFDKPAVHSGNMYQIYAYVKNRDSDNTGKVSGLLLYAKTDEEMHNGEDFGSEQDI